MGAVANDLVQPVHRCSVLEQEISQEQRQRITRIDRSQPVSPVVVALDDTSEALGALTFRDTGRLVGRVIGVDRAGNYVVNTDQKATRLLLSCQSVKPLDRPGLRLGHSMDGFIRGTRTRLLGGGELGAFARDRSLVIYSD